MNFQCTWPFLHESKENEQQKVFCLHLGFCSSLFQRKKEGIVQMNITFYASSFLYSQTMRLFFSGATSTSWNVLFTEKRFVEPRWKFPIKVPHAFWPVLNSSVYFEKSVSFFVLAAHYTTSLRLFSASPINLIQYKTAVNRNQNRFLNS